KDNSFHIGVDVLTSVNTLSFYRGNPKTNIYLITGVEYFNPSVTQSINGGAYNSFTSPSNNSTLKNLGLNLGIGAAFKISNKYNLALEAKNTLTNNGYLASYSPWVGSKAYNSWWYAGVKFNINLGDPAKRVQPLWWINPNNYAYNELNAPKHMKMPKVVLPDADGDGVTDQFDLEPNTPAGAPVDSHGVSKDTDGDGVPDYRDKEPLTPRNCFPVNNDGIGTCPEPACCKELRDQISNMKLAAATECTISDLPSIHFKSGAKLSKDAEKLLAAAATKIKANPNCKVKVIGHPTASKAAQQLSYERVSAVIKYLVEKEGIAESRFIFNYDGGSGDASTIDLLGTTEDGPNTVPAPHPNLRSKG
ncbi:MAG TPA: OmpA family protein, partial [Chitinophagaceae bacterium]|nr:OmpA family protein [Chitinophagaceae bacterium]